MLGRLTNKSNGLKDGILNIYYSFRTFDTRKLGVYFCDGLDMYIILTSLICITVLILQITSSLIIMLCWVRA